MIKESALLVQTAPAPDDGPEETKAAPRETEAPGLIDELILKVNPVVLGSGIPLFSGIEAQTRLEFVDSKTYKSGILMLRYRVKS